MFLCKFGSATLKQCTWMQCYMLIILILVLVTVVVSMSSDSHHGWADIKCHQQFYAVMCLLIQCSSQASPPAGWIWEHPFPAKPSRSLSESLWLAAHSFGCSHPWAAGQTHHKEKHNVIRERDWEKEEGRKSHLNLPRLCDHIFCVSMQPNSQQSCSHLHIFLFLLSDVESSVILHILLSSNSQMTPRLWAASARGRKLSTETSCTFGKLSCRPSLYTV